MATGTFTYNALKERVKHKKNCKSFKLNNSDAVRIGTTSVKPYLSIFPVGLVCFARCCGKTYSRHFFSVDSCGAPGHGREKYHLIKNYGSKHLYIFRSLFLKMAHLWDVAKNAQAECKGKL